MTLEMVSTTRKPSVSTVQRTLNESYGISLIFLLEQIIYRVCRIPTAAEEAWIVKHCRKDTIGNVGYRPDLYERWMAGRKLETFEFKASYVDSEGDQTNAMEMLRKTAKLTF